MNAKLLTLMALLSLAALAAGSPYDNKRDRTDMDALRLIGEIAREQVFEQESETAEEQQNDYGMYVHLIQCTQIQNLNLCSFHIVCSGKWRKCGVLACCPGLHCLKLFKICVPFPVGK